MVSTVASQQEGSWFEPRQGGVWSVHVLPVLAWVFSRYFLQSKDMDVRLTDGSKLPVGMIVSVYGCSSTCGPVMDWGPVQGVPLPFTRRELG